MASNAANNLVKSGQTVVEKYGIELCVILGISMILLIVSMVVPYYNGTTGDSGVFESQKDCLGFAGDECGAIQAIPVLALLFGIFLMIAMCGSQVPIINKFYGAYSRIPVLGALLSSIPILFCLVFVFSVINFALQMGMPLSGMSLDERSKMASDAVVFKEGMALSATSTALVILAAFIASEAVYKVPRTVRSWF